MMCSNLVRMGITNNTLHMEVKFSVIQKTVQTSNEIVFNKNRVIRTAKTRMETRDYPPMYRTYFPNPLCAVTQQCELGMQVHCIGGQLLVSLLFVAVLITLFSF